MATNKQTPQDEDAYRKATKTVVDDAMRTDILGPNLVKVLENLKPADTLIKAIVAEAIKSNPEVRQELTVFIANDSTTKRNKWIDRAIVAFLSIVATGIIQYTINHLNK